MAQLAYGEKENSFCLPCFFFPSRNMDFRRILGKIPITGTVKDSSGAGMSDVTVSEKGTNNATTTSVDGTFSITVAGSKSTLVFTSVGYAPQEVKSR